MHEVQMFTSNANERGKVRGMFSLGKAFWRGCVSGGAGTKRRFCGSSHAAGWVDVVSADPGVLLCPKGMQQEASGF